jgi:hypothetical protein
MSSEASTVAPGWSLVILIRYGRATSAPSYRGLASNHCHRTDGLLVLCVRSARSSPQGPTSRVTRWSADMLASGLRQGQGLSWTNLILLSWSVAGQPLSLAMSSTPRIRRHAATTLLLAFIHRYSNLSPGRSHLAFILNNAVSIVSGSYDGNRRNHFSSKLFKCWLVRGATLATALF